MVVRLAYKRCYLMCIIKEIIYRLYYTPIKFGRFNFYNGEIMNADLDLYNAYVIKAILANNELGITEVNNIEDVASRYFIKNEYPEIVKLITNGDLNTLRSLAGNGAESREFLHVLSFIDQGKNKYIVTVYDSDELWQDPQVIDIFRIAT